MSPGGRSRMSKLKFFNFLYIPLSLVINAFSFIGRTEHFVYPCGTSIFIFDFWELKRFSSVYAKV